MKVVFIWDGLISEQVILAALFMKDLKFKTRNDSFIITVVFICLC